MGRLIVIEGLDGSGKSTQIDLLFQKLEKAGESPFKIKLPYYSDPSSTLVKMYLSGEFGSDPSDVNCFAGSSFYAVDRYASFKKHWGREYESGRLIIADRYTTSNAYHQMTKLEKSEWDEYLDWLFDYEYKKLKIPEPDAVIFLDMPIEVSQKLMSERYSGDEEKKDVHEVNTAYLACCRETAAYAAQKLGWSVVACSENGRVRSKEDISSEIFSIIESILQR